MVQRRLLLVLLACSCSSKPVREGSLEVTVTLAQGLRSVCAKVRASGEGQVAESNAMTLAGRTTLHVGVGQGALPDTVSLSALGYSDEACTTPTSPAETSETKEGTFAMTAARVQLTLAPAASTDGGFDGDGDGYLVPLDCDDGDATVNPDAGEQCSNNRDDDCDTLHDCADGDCANAACGVGGVCTGGHCVAANENGLCADGFDNDADGKIDCVDPDCPAGAPCSDSDLCTSGDTCDLAGACVPTSLTVCALPNACFSGGVCRPDAGTCDFTLGSTGTCSDARKCTLSDACLADGGCAGTQVTCPPLNLTCFATVGTCREDLDGGCDYPPLATGPCDDGDACTTNDACTGDGGCMGTRPACQPPNDCFNPTSACTVDGGCVFMIRTGQTCDGGVCDSSGACNFPNPFPFTPSNFLPSQLPPSSTALTLGCGTTVLDTLTADGGVQWLNLCAGQTAPAYKVITVGTIEALLMSVDAFILNGGAKLRLTGARPVILASKGGITVNGTIDVGSTHDAGTGAGSNRGCGVGNGDDGAASGNPNTAGGGGGGAFAGDGGMGTDGDMGGPRGAGGRRFGTTNLVPLRPGCAGGNGGRAAGGWGTGGPGGGAVQLSAVGSIVLNGGSIITAYGAGGRGGQADQRIAGGGGGSGGAILLEANTVVLNGGSTVTANGGAGGEGSGYNGTQWFGCDGQNGSQTTSAAAVCVSIGACGGNGGLGGAGVLTSGGNAGGPECGPQSPGGGGGGSVGRIRFNAATSCSGVGVVSPTATSNGATGCP